ncbi:MAG: alpha/beta hydrolase, partial [Bacteroidales bacterium]|nr:alpha/beta hydrolase [Bacteroidales bacterium]
WLSLLLAGRYPDQVLKLILVASAPFEDYYVPGITKTRINRLDKEEGNMLSEQVKKIQQGEKETQNAIFCEIAGILKKADAYSPAGDNNEHVNMDYSMYRSIWPEAEKLRSSGELLDMASEVRCPVLAIHGDHDPHPAEGVRIPLEGIIRDFRFILLPKCGHEPWTERYAEKKFIQLLEKEI